MFVSEGFEIFTILITASNIYAQPLNLRTRWTVADQSAAQLFVHKGGKVVFPA